MFLRRRQDQFGATESAPLSTGAKAVAAVGILGVLGAAIGIAASSGGKKPMNGALRSQQPLRKRGCGCGR